MNDLPNFDEFVNDEDFEGFDPSEISILVGEYVSACCHGTLVPYHVPNDRIYIILCSECQNSIERMGAITKNTVSIRYENGKREFETVIKNLKDLYLSLQHMTVSKSQTPLKDGESEKDRNIRELGF